MPPTRIVRLRDESRRHRSTNPRTRFLTPESLAEGRAAPSCEVAFVTAYPTLREVCASVAEPCVAAFAVDEQGVAAHALFQPHDRLVQTAIIGRHTSADLFLADDQQLSLRHLALVLHPRRRGELPAYHVIDLRTPLGMADERGRPVEHVAAGGPLFLQLGAYALILLPLPWKRVWPTDALEAWRALPPRTYVEEERPLPRRPAPPPEAGATGVQVIRGARFAQRGLAEPDDVRVGQLQVRSQRGSSTFVLGAKALHGGVLLGRYDRCDNAGLPVMSDHRISRVHVLLIRIGEVVYAIDTASTNGIWHQGVEVRHHALEHGHELEIGSRLAWVSWHPID